MNLRVIPHYVEGCTKLRVEVELSGPLIDECLAKPWHRQDKERQGNMIMIMDYVIVVHLKFDDCSYKCFVKGSQADH